MSTNPQQWLNRCHGYGLAQLRKAAGLTQTEVERHLRLPRKTLSAWERGARQISCRDRKAALAFLYGVSYGVLACAGYPTVDIPEGTDPSEVWKRVRP